MGEQDGGLSSDGGTAASQPEHRPVPYFPPPPTGLTLPFLSPELPVPAEAPPGPAPAAPAEAAGPGTPSMPADRFTGGSGGSSAADPRPSAADPRPSSPHPPGTAAPVSPGAGPERTAEPSPGTVAVTVPRPRPSSPAGSHVPLTLAAPVATTAAPTTAPPPPETEPKATASDRTPEPAREPTREPAPEPAREPAPGTTPEPPPGTPAERASEPAREPKAGGRESAPPRAADHAPRPRPRPRPDADADADENDRSGEDAAASPGGPPAIEIVELVEGRIRIEDEVIEKIAVLAALEVHGVAALSGHPAGLPGGLHDAGGQGHRRARATVQDDQVTVDLVIAVSYGSVVMDVARLVKTNVARVVSGMLGIKVRAVNVTIDDVRMPTGPTRRGTTGPEPVGPEPMRSGTARPVTAGGR